MSVIQDREDASSSAIAGLRTGPCGRQAAARMSGPCGTAFGKAGR